MEDLLRELGDIRALINEVYEDETDTSILKSRDCFRKYCDDIKQALKALAIIKAIKPFTVYETVGGKYLLETIVDEVGLTKENYDLLKEVLP